MLKAILSNFILSKVNIDKAKRILGNTTILKPFLKISSQILIDRRYPTHVFIETTRACNLACTCCPRSINPSQCGHMTFDLFKKIIDEANKFGRRNFSLHMLGEPLVHPRITEFVQYIKSSQLNHAIILTTNGYFLDEYKAKVLIESKVDKIVISIFSLKPHRLKLLTGNADLHKVIDNIKNVAKLNKKMHGKTKTFIRFLLHTNNADEREDFLALAKTLEVKLEVRDTHNYSGVINNNRTNKILKQKRYPCYHLWLAPAITWDGKVVLCCNDWACSEVLGDVRREFLSDIWQGKRMKELRNLHLKQRYEDIPLCEKCNVWTIYPDIFFGFQKQKTIIKQ